MSTFMIRVHWAMIVVIGFAATIVPTPLAAAEPDKPASGNDKIEQMQKERVEALREAAKQISLRFESGTIDIDQLRLATRELLDAELDLCKTNKERVAALEKYVAVAKKHEAIASNFVKTGQAPSTVGLNAKADRLKAEILLERLRQKLDAKPGTGKANEDVRDRLALADKETYVRKAVVVEASARSKKALAELDAVRGRVAEAKADVVYREQQLKRFSELGKLGEVMPELIDEHQSRLDAAKARLVSVQALVSEREADIKITNARLDQAKAELEKALLTVQQLDSRLKARE